MRSSFRLGAVSGIPIGFHWSIAAIAGLFGYTLAGTILPAAAPGFAAVAYLTVAAVVTVALLASIVAHELGHSLIAQRNDIGVASITLFALGGVARLEREPETPGSAARIAVAGPAVSVAIGIAALAAGMVAGSMGAHALMVAGLTWLGLVNLSLAVFNMLPALPLDGGRALQALLWKRSGDRDQATISAASVGRYIGWAIMALGAWQFFATGSGLWTMIIGWFIVTSARAEAVRARFQTRGRQPLAPPSPFARSPFHPGAPYPGAPEAPYNTAPGAPYNTAPRAPYNTAPDAPRPSPWAPPLASDRASVEIIDVDGRRVG